MRLCILCEDKNITEARKRSTGVLPISEIVRKIVALKKGSDTDFQHLKIPVSVNGELPATHWFCFINVNEETHQKMLTSQMYTIIEEAVPSEFLTKHNLKKIKSFGPGL